MHCIDHSSRWSLHCDPDQAAESQHITNTPRIPSTRSKIGSQEGTEPGLHVGEEKVQPFKRSHTPLFSWCRIAHRVSFLVSWLSAIYSLFRASPISVEPCRYISRLPSVRLAQSIKHDGRHLQKPLIQQILWIRCYQNAHPSVRFVTFAHRRICLGRNATLP